MQAHKGMAKNMAKSVKNGVKKESFLTKVKNGMTSFGGGIQSVVSSMASSVSNGIKSFVAKPTEAIKSLFKRQPRLKAVGIVALVAAVIVSAVFPPAIPVFVAAGVAAGTWFAIFGKEAYIKHEENVFKEKVETEVPEFVGSEITVVKQLGGAGPNAGQGVDQEVTQPGTQPGAQPGAQPRSENEPTVAGQLNL